MTRRSPRLDKFHQQVDLCFRLLGCTTQSLAGVGKGCPDILVGAHGVDFLVEVKTEGNRLETEQTVWHQRWRGRRVITLNLLKDSTADEIMALCKSIISAIKEKTWHSKERKNTRRN